MLFRDYVNFVLVLLFCIIIVVVDNDVIVIVGRGDFCYNVVVNW